MPHTSPPTTETRWYWGRFRATFRAAAPGRTSRALITKRPTQVMVMVTTTAMAAVKRKFFHTTRMPRLSARAWWTEESIMGLKEVTHRITTPRRMRASRPISPGATLRMSPMRRLLNLVKLCPPRVLRKMPRATAAEEKTLMAVSLAMWVFWRMRVKSRAMTTAKTTAAPTGSCLLYTSDAADD